MKSLHVVGLCNPLVDIFADISEAQLLELGFEKGTMRLTELSDQKALLEKLGANNNTMRSGGSVSNSIIAIAQLGGKAAFNVNLGDDELGRFFKSECTALGIEMPVPLSQTGATGTCVSLLTPDAERTMRTYLGASVNLSRSQIDKQSIENSEWLFVEGYVFSNSDAGRDAIKEGVATAKSTNTKVALTCSEAWVVNSFTAPLRETLESTQLIFANEEESAALSGCTDVISSGRELSQKFPHVVLTAGPKGAHIWWEGEHIHVPAYACQPRDLTGAGDMFAGAFLYGITNGYSPSDAASRANFLAREVIVQVGARLTGDVKGFWNAAAQGQDALGAANGI